jgi:hypothetical protein
MAKAKTKQAATKAFALAYNSYSVDAEMHRFDSPPIARAAFSQALAKAKKSKRAPGSDATPSTAPFDAERVQLEWDGELVRRAWFTAHEEPGEHVTQLGATKRPTTLASELLAAALELPAFAKLEEIGIGLQQWQNSHRATLDPVLDVLAAKRPAIRALALGDYDNEGGHIMKLASPARIAELYPALERLRITTTSLVSLDGVALPALRSLWLRGTSRELAALSALDRPWPALASLGIGWQRSGSKETLDHWAWLLAGERTPALVHLALSGTTFDGPLVAALATSPLLPRLRRLELHALDDASQVVSTLRTHAAAFAHLDLVLPERIGGLEELGLRVALHASAARFRSSRE